MFTVICEDCPCSQLISENVDTTSINEVPYNEDNHRETRLGKRVNRVNRLCSEVYSAAHQFVQCGNVAGEEDISSLKAKIQRMRMLVDMSEVTARALEVKNADDPYITDTWNRMVTVSSVDEHYRSMNIGIESMKLSSFMGTGDDSVHEGRVIHMNRMMMMLNHPQDMVFISSLPGVEYSINPESIRTGYLRINDDQISIHFNNGDATLGVREGGSHVDAARADRFFRMMPPGRYRCGISTEVGELICSDPTEFNKYGMSCFGILPGYPVYCLVRTWYLHHLEERRLKSMMRAPSGRMRQHLDIDSMTHAEIMNRMSRPTRTRFVSRMKDLSGSSSIMRVNVIIVTFDGDVLTPVRCCVSDLVDLRSYLI
jgi:hypothetical protein